jgi:hypothetical protein
MLFCKMKMEVVVNQRLLIAERKSEYEMDILRVSAQSAKRENQHKLNLIRVSSENDTILRSVSNKFRNDHSQHSLPLLID